MTSLTTREPAADSAGVCGRCAACQSTCHPRLKPFCSANAAPRDLSLHRWGTTHTEYRKPSQEYKRLALLEPLEPAAAGSGASGRGPVEAQARRTAAVAEALRLQQGNQSGGCYLRLERESVPEGRGAIQEGREAPDAHGFTRADESEVS